MGETQTVKAACVLDHDFPFLAEKILRSQADKLRKSYRAASRTGNCGPALVGRLECWIKWQ